MPVLLRSHPSISLNSTASAVGQGLIIGLLSALCLSALICLCLILVYVIKSSLPGRIFLQAFGRPGDYDDEEQLRRLEERYLDSMPERERLAYLAAKDFTSHHPPESVDTSISLTNFLLIQDKGVSAWEFMPEVETAPILVNRRTEITFEDDSCCCVQTSLPIPTQNEVYYWEAKIMSKPESTMISVGMAAKPYPTSRLPGYHRFSFGYRSDGQLFINQPFESINYDYLNPIQQGDVVGIGYCPGRNSIFFTFNGSKKREIEFRHHINWFPTIGATGPCQVDVNLGHMAFLCIEANVKRWGLAPAVGSRPPPPAYGCEAGNPLLASGLSLNTDGSDRSDGPSLIQFSTYRRNVCPSPGPSPGPGSSPTAISLAQLPVASSHIPHRYQISSTGEIESTDPPPPKYDTLSPHPGTQTYSHSQYSRQTRQPQEETSPPSPPISYDAVIAQDQARRNDENV